MVNQFTKHFLHYFTIQILTLLKSTSHNKGFINFFTRQFNNFLTIHFYFKIKRTTFSFKAQFFHNASYCFLRNDITPFNQIVMYSWAAINPETLMESWHSKKLSKIVDSLKPHYLTVNLYGNALAFPLNSSTFM
jgi:hypothetical protein